MNSQNLHTAPSFAVVGKVNAGKSSVLATLLEVDDEKALRISSTPGETTECQRFPISFDNETYLDFIDTPGFSRPIDAMNAVKKLADEGTRPTKDTLKRFITKFKHSGEFEDECRLLEPMLNGSGLLYVIDPSKPLRQSFIAEMELLRWTGQPRLALLNQKGAHSEFLSEWKSTLGSYFNLVRTFNAHTAKYEERLRLIRSLLEIDESHQKAITTVIQYMEMEWDQRREDATDAIITFLEKALTYREVASLTERDLSVSSRKERKLRELSDHYFDQIRRLETKLHKSLLKTFQHHLLTIQQSSSTYEAMDLFSEETWQKWGLSRTQLTMAAGATGAAGGLMLDIGTGGLTHGFGTLIGALGGAAAAFFKGGSLPNFGFSVGGGLKMESKDGKALSVGPPSSDNFSWILLDSCLNHYLQIISRAHAIRSKDTLTHDGSSLTRSLSREDRTTLAKWFATCKKGSPDRGLEPAVFECLLTYLEELESSHESP